MTESSHRELRRSNHLLDREHREHLVVWWALPMPCGCLTRHGGGNNLFVGVFVVTDGGVAPVTTQHRLIQVHVQKSKHFTLVNATFCPIFDQNSLIVDMVDRYAV